MPISLTFSTISPSLTRREGSQGSSRPTLCWTLLPRSHRSCTVSSSPPQSTAGQGGGEMDSLAASSLASLCPSSPQLQQPSQYKSVLQTQKGPGAHSFHKYLVGIHCVPGPALASRDLKRNRTDKNPRSCTAYVLPSTDQIPVSGRKLLRMGWRGERAKALGGSRPNPGGY